MALPKSCWNSGKALSNYDSKPIHWMIFNTVFLFYRPAISVGSLLQPTLILLFTNPQIRQPWMTGYRGSKDASVGPKFFPHKKLKDFPSDPSQVLSCGFFLIMGVRICVCKIQQFRTEFVWGENIVGSW